MGNWDNAVRNKKQARDHIMKMEENYKNEIMYSVYHTSVYQDCLGETNGTGNGHLMDMRRVEGLCGYTTNGIFQNAGKNITVLNFASYKEAGGMYLEGSMAQEEALCSQSFLYNVLSKHQGYYDRNKELGLSRGLYQNRALYSPSVYFFDENGKEYKANVITCACPNRKVAQQYCGVTNEENYAVLKKRAEFVLDIAEKNRTSVLVLGAWGCGVFGQDVNEVARAFREALDSKYYSFQKVVFAIPEADKLNTFMGTFFENDRQNLMNEHEK